MVELIGGLDSPPTGAVADAALAEIMSHPEFPVVAYALMDGWAPHAEPPGDGAMSRRLRDVGSYLAGVWALQLAAEPTGLTPTTMGAMLGKTGYGSRNRAIALLAYLQFTGLVEPLPPGVDGRDRRERRFQPTTPLRRLFMNRFQRELTLIAPLDQAVADCLERWETPGLADVFAIAHGRYMTQALLSYDRDKPTLEAISHLNAGLTVLGQIITQARHGDEFPPTGPSRVNLANLARRSGVSRGQARAVLRAGAKAGFFQDDQEGRIHFSPALRDQLGYLLGSYIACLSWSARQALGCAPRS